MNDRDTQAVELERLVTSARDALSDDIVGRLAAVCAEGLELLDRINRSAAADALPTLAAMASNGDLERIAQLARLASSAQDALNDDIVTRLASVISEGLALLDRLTRDDTLANLAQSLTEANREMATKPHAKGGYGNLVKLLSQSDVQDGLQYLALIAKRIHRS